MDKNDIKNAADLVITPDMIDKGAAGTVSYWKLGGSVLYAALADAWRAAGLPEKQLPRRPSAEIVLHRSVADLAGKRRLVRPLARRGAWAVVDETAGTETLRYDTDGMLTVRYVVEGTGDEKTTEIVLDPADHPLAEKVRQGCESHEGLLATTDITAWLVKRANALGAVCLRDSGGVYFIPRPGVAVWRRICEVLESVNKQHHVFRLPAMKNDEAAAAILDAIVSEAEGAANEMEAELTALADNPDDGIGARALGNRARRCTEVQGKIGTYESLLGVRMDSLRERFTELQARLAAAALAAMPDEEAAA